MHPAEMDRRRGRDQAKVLRDVADMLIGGHTEFGVAWTVDPDQDTWVSPDQWYPTRDQAANIGVDRSRAVAHEALGRLPLTLRTKIVHRQVGPWRFEHHD